MTRTSGFAVLLGDDLSVSYSELDDSTVADIEIFMRERGDYSCEVWSASFDLEDGPIQLIKKIRIYYLDKGKFTITRPKGPRPFSPGYFRLS